MGGGRHMGVIPVGLRDISTHSTSQLTEWIMLGTSRTIGEVIGANLVGDIPLCD